MSWRFLWFGKALVEEYFHGVDMYAANNFSSKYPFEDSFHLMPLICVQSEVS